MESKQEPTESEPGFSIWLPRDVGKFYSVSGEMVMENQGSIVGSNNNEKNDSIMYSIIFSLWKQTFC